MQVQTGRLFIVIITIIAYAIALRAPETIFELASQYAFSGYAALSPLLFAALFWRGSTKWGALVSTVWVVIAVISVAALISTLLTIRAEYKGPRRQVYAFKPLTVVLVILITMQTKHAATPHYRQLIVAGLLCSLAHR